MSVAELELSSHCVMRYWAALQDCLHREQATAELNDTCGRHFTAQQWYEILDSALNRVVAPR